MAICFQWGVVVLASEDSNSELANVTILFRGEGVVSTKVIWVQDF